MALRSLDWIHVLLGNVNPQWPTFEGCYGQTKIDNAKFTCLLWQTVGVWLFYHFEQGEIISKEEVNEIFWEVYWGFFQRPGRTVQLGRWCNLLVALIKFMDKVKDGLKNKERSVMLVMSVWCYIEQSRNDTQAQNRQFRVMAFSHCFFSLAVLSTFPSILAVIILEWLSWL